MKIKYLFILLALSLTSCQTGPGRAFKTFYGSPSGNSITEVTATYVVSQAVLAQPTLIPILEALADTQEGIPVDLGAFEEPLYAIGVQLVGQVVTMNGNEATSKTVANALRNGIALAFISQPSPSNK